MTLIEELERRVELKKQLVILTEEEIAELELKIEEEISDGSN
jgi:hypothetical protein